MITREIRRALDGAWEERGVVGTRIEIKKDCLTVLWRGGVVLETKFGIEQNGERITIVPASRGMRYENASSDYATVSDIYCENGSLFFEEDFPITGKSVTKLEKTENSRYGNVTFADSSVLRDLRGEWRDERNYHTLVFNGDTLEINGEKIKIRVVCDVPDKTFSIIDGDPSKDGVGCFYRMEYRGDRIAARVMVCDAEPETYIFHKMEKGGK